MRVFVFMHTCQWAWPGRFADRVFCRPARVSKHACDCVVLAFGKSIYRGVHPFEICLSVRARVRVARSVLSLWGENSPPIHSCAESCEWDSGEEQGGWGEGQRGVARRMSS